MPTFYTQNRGTIEISQEERQEHIKWIIDHDNLGHEREYTEKDAWEALEEYRISGKDSYCHVGTEGKWYLFEYIANVGGRYFGYIDAETNFPNSPEELGWKNEYIFYLLFTKEVKKVIFTT